MDSKHDNSNKKKSQSDNKASYFEFFPRDQKKEIRLDDAYAYLIFFGTFGVHQFYLGNKKRGYYLLVTCGISHLLLLFTNGLQVGPVIEVLGWKVALAISLFGYVLGAPVWLWDLVTLPWQVLNKKGNTTSF